MKLSPTVKEAVADGSVEISQKEDPETCSRAARPRTRQNGRLEVQPFTFERPKDTSLYNLNEMALVDKHRLPLLAVIRGRVSAMTAEDENAEMMWFGGSYDDSVEAGSVLATFDARVPDSMKLNAIVAFDMAGRRPARPSRRPHDGDDVASSSADR